uniref:Secreted protein n=1 Tax=Aquila chrysaetos chrysaetos TaxID=223781 RepID=A0A663DQP9_AQUCH
MLPQCRACVSSPSTRLVGLILSLCLHSGATGLGNPTSHCRQAQAHPTHPCVACTAFCLQKRSLLDDQTGLLKECRQQYSQWLLTELLARLTCRMSDIPCAKNRKTSPLLHFTLLILKQ